MQERIRIIILKKNYGAPSEKKQYEPKAKESNIPLPEPPSESIPPVEEENSPLIYGRSLNLKESITKNYRCWC